jgi:nondiscriminating aspartyl-tRNA synthetase
MERTTYSSYEDKVGQVIQVSGWLEGYRDIGSIAFGTLRDGEGYTQLVLEKQAHRDLFKDVQLGSVISLKGKLKESGANAYDYEIADIEDLAVDVEVEAVTPIEYNKKDMDINLHTALKYRPLSLRNRKNIALFKTQTGIVQGFRRSLEDQGFTEFRSPVLLGVPSESGADVFDVDYYGKKAYLAQSPQLNKQIMVGAFEKVFTIASAFRAEKHNTSRHLIELTQMDAEMGFIESYEELLDVAEKVVRDVLNYLDTSYKEELDIWEVELPKLPNGDFPRLKVREALEMIENETGKSADREEFDVDPEDERLIGKWGLEKHDSDFVWLTHFKGDKNFYTWNNPDEGSESLSFDLICRGLEWLSGTHRIHEYDKLVENMKKEGFNLEHYKHYLQAFQYGMPSEGGFSFGLERMTQQIFELDNIREATLFPSDLKRIAGQKV